MCHIQGNKFHRLLKKIFLLLSAMYLLLLRRRYRICPTPGRMTSHGNMTSAPHAGGTARHFFVRSHCIPSFPHAALPISSVSGVVFVFSQMMKDAPARNTEIYAIGFSPKYNVSSVPTSELNRAANRMKITKTAASAIKYGSVPISSSPQKLSGKRIL